MSNPWHYASLVAPSHAVERDRVVDTLAVLGVPPDCWSDLNTKITTGKSNYSVIMTPTTGWGGGATYEPTMLMSFYTDTDHAKIVQADPSVMGELYRAECNGIVYHVAHWPVCGNLSLLTLTEPPTDTPTNLNGLPTNIVSEPVSVSEPGTILLLSFGLALLWRKLH